MAAGNINKRGSGFPTGQTSRGVSQTTSGNRKNNSARRPDVTRTPSDAVVRVNQTDADGDQLSTGYQRGDSPSRFNAGSDNTGNVTPNRGYTQVRPGSLPATSNPGANRQRFGIDPGSQELGGDGTPVARGPEVPKYGTGSTGD
jgi:hypothetical protein